MWTPLSDQPYTQDSAGGHVPEPMSAARHVGTGAPPHVVEGVLEDRQPPRGVQDHRRVAARGGEDAGARHRCGELVLATGGDGVVLLGDDDRGGRGRRSRGGKGKGGGDQSNQGGNQRW